MSDTESTVKSSPDYYNSLVNDKKTFVSFLKQYCEEIDIKFSKDSETFITNKISKDSNIGKQQMKAIIDLLINEKKERTTNTPKRGIPKVKISIDEIMKYAQLEGLKLFLNDLVNTDQDINKLLEKSACLYDYDEKYNARDVEITEQYYMDQNKPNNVSTNSNKNNINGCYNKQNNL